MVFHFQKLKKREPKLKKPIFIEGLPGIGNVGKVVVDFLIDELSAKKLFEISSDTFPHSVFVTEDNLVELPKIVIYYKKFADRRPDLILMTGDVQPTDEASSYEFCGHILRICQEYGVREIVTLGGIGLMEIPEEPNVYCASAQREIIDRYVKGTQLKDKLYGVVGPIMGVTGLLLGLSPKKGIPSISILAETLNHPAYLGVKGARESLKAINRKLRLRVSLSDLDEEIQKLEKELLKRTKNLSDVQKNSAMNKMNRKMDVNYIG